jgi:hypothetical protein
MRFFRAIEAPRSVEDEVALARLAAVASRGKEGSTPDWEKPLEVAVEPQSPEPLQ